MLGGAGAGAALIVVSRDRADKLGLKPLGELVGYGQVAGPDASLLLQPAGAIRQALEHSGIALSEVDLFEINEAFAAVGVASMDDLGISDDVTNVNGGAIALGHPIGMSGARLALTALTELRRRGGGTAAVALCGGGGQGDAALLRSVSYEGRLEGLLPPLDQSPIRLVESAGCSQPIRGHPTTGAARRRTGPGTSPPGL